MELDEFARRYCGELHQNPALEELRALVLGHPRVTLIYAAHDPLVNHAAVLQDCWRSTGEHSPQS